MRIILLLLLPVIVIGAEPTLAKKTAAPRVSTAQVDPTEESLTHEYLGREINELIRELARKARMNVVLETSIKGTINLRLENKTPREVIEIIGQANRLVIDELNGVYYIKSWDQPFKQQAEWIAHSTKLMVDAYMEKGFTRAEAMDLIRNLPGGIQLEPRPKAPEMHTKRATR